MRRASITMKKSTNRSSLIREDDAQFSRNNTNISESFYQPIDNKKIIKDLEKMLKEERFKREELQEYIEASKIRNIRREKQFYRILECTNKEVINLKKTQEKGETTVDQILGLFSKVFQQFEESNNATNHFIEKRYSENLGMMERRIFQISEVFNKQITKNKKISEDSYRKIRGDLQSIIILTRNIEDDNIKLKKQLDEQNFKNKLLVSEKQLLIQEMVEKKKLIHKLYNDRVNFQKIFKSDKMATIPINPEHHDAYQTPTRELDKTIQDDIVNCQKSMSIQNKVISRFTTASSKSKVRQLNRTLNFINKNDGNRDDKIIGHLKASLARQKQKVFEMGKLVSKMQRKNQEINQALEDILLSNKKESKKNEGSMEKLLKFERLVQTIKTLKKRLSTCQEPSISCGWGQLDCTQLIEFDQSKQITAD